MLYLACVLHYRKSDCSVIITLAIFSHCLHLTVHHLNYSGQDIFVVRVDELSMLCQPLNIQEWCIFYRLRLLVRTGVWWALSACCSTYFLSLLLFSSSNLSSFCLKQPLQIGLPDSMQHHGSTWTTICNKAEAQAATNSESRWSVFCSFTCLYPSLSLSLF